MYLIAATEKSIGLLHTCTTLAVSTNTPIDIAMLNPTHCPLAESEKHVIDDIVQLEYIAEGRAGACFITRIDGGDRTIMANGEFEFLFESSDSMAKRLSGSPHLKLWRRFLADDSAADLFTSEMIKAWLKAGDPVVTTQNRTPTIRWSCELGQTIVKDQLGNRYTATLCEHGVLAGQGFLCHLVFGFKSLVPLDAGGAARLAEFKELQQQQLAGQRFQSMPSYQRIDSVLSLLMPEPTNQPEAAVQQGAAWQHQQQQEVQNQDRAGVELSGFGSLSGGAGSCGRAGAGAPASSLARSSNSLSVPMDEGGAASHRTKDSGAPLAKPGSSFEWPESPLVSFDSDLLWNTMDRLASTISGHSDSFGSVKSAGNTNGNDKTNPNAASASQRITEAPPAVGAGVPSAWADTTRMRDQSGSQLGSLGSLSAIGRLEADGWGH